jgi:ABC-type dipeptide/oligopeptide/nickel transport system permease component
MSTLFKCLFKTIVIVLMGGFMGATLVRFAPGYGVSEEELDSRLSAASVQALRQSHEPPPGLIRYYGGYWRNVLRGDLGFSNVMQEPVRQLIAERFPETLKSVGFGLVLGWTIGLGLAVASVTARSAAIDRGMSLVATVAICTPAAVLALLCVMARAPGRLVIAAIVFPKVFQYARNLLLRSSRLPHVLAAAARGLSRARIFCWHILPVSAPQLLAVAGVTVSMAFTAAIPVEALCDIPGIGQLAWKAALGRDLELLIMLTMIVTTITLLANSTAELLGKTAHR